MKDEYVSLSTSWTTYTTGRMVPIEGYVSSGFYRLGTAIVEVKRGMKHRSFGIVRKEGIVETNDTLHRINNIESRVLE
jgi:hypothetical protein